MIFRQLKIMVYGVVIFYSLSLCGMQNYSPAQLEAGNPYVNAGNATLATVVGINNQGVGNCAMACAFGCAMCAVRACDYCDRTELCRWVQQANIYSEQLLGALYSCGQVAEHNE